MRKLILSSILICVPLFSALAVQLAAGELHSLVLKEAGTVWAWGDNLYGQLGDSTTESRYMPVQVVGLSEVIAISAGPYGSHSLAVKRDGTAWAWGYNGWGQLGNGTGGGMDPTPHPIPELVIGISEVIAVAGGSIHSLFLKSDSTVWSVGSNRNGQLGDGTTAEHHTPKQVSGLSDVIAIACGGEHSLALKSNGTVWAWGKNVSGQLGDGNGGSNEPYNAYPQQVIGLSNVIAIAGGSGHSLALKRDGTVWAWGGNYGGQLGDENGWTNSYIPVQSLVSGVVAIEAGEWFSIALTSYGIVWFWGSISSYSGDYIWSIIPMPVDGISHVKAIAAGDEHILAVKDDCTIWAWGQNVRGQLGNGTNDYYGLQRSPVQVQGFSTDSSDPVINPDVKVNSANGPLTVSAFTPITVTVQISPAYSGLEADWWIAAKGGGAWFYLTLEDFLPKWTAMTDYTEMQPIAQGPLAPIGPVPIIESEYWLPRGDYEFFFAVDTLMDGLLTLEALHYDSAILTIQ